MPESPRALNQPRRHAAVFFTGGTSGMRPLKDSPGVAPAQAFDRLMAELAGLTEGVALKGVQWADIPSPHMTPLDMFRLARDVEAVLADPAVSGAVVIHGTDTMEESAFMADLLLAGPKPVVFTGAMRYLGELGYDGLRNLLFAIRAAADPAMDGVGVTVLMADRLFAASEVTKVHSTGIDPFDAPDAGPLGYEADDGVHLIRRPGRRFHVPAPGLEPGVDLITLAPGQDGRLIEAAREAGAAGMVVVGFGAGNVPPAVVQALAQTANDGLPVVLTTRCLAGGVRPIYGYPGGAADLVQKGVILGGRLPGHKARILLMAALGAGLNPAEIRDLFSRA
jgi:L-asparaginase